MVKKINARILIKSKNELTNRKLPLIAQWRALIYQWWCVLNKMSTIASFGVIPIHWDIQTGIILKSITKKNWGSFSSTYVISPKSKIFIPQA